MSVLLNKVTEVVVTGVVERSGEYSHLPYIVALRYDDTQEKVIAVIDQIADAISLAKERADEEDADIDIAPGNITRFRAENYLDHDATFCPYCKSPNIIADHIDLESMVQVVRCTLCRRTWRNIFALVGVGDKDSEYFKDGYDETLSNNADE